MAYAKIDDGILDHPKCLMAGEDATNLFIRSIIWCNKHLTDGFVPHEACTTLTRSRNLKKQIAALLRVGLWEEIEGGYRISGFLDHNDSKEEVQRKRELAAERQRRSRAKRAQQTQAGSASVTRDKRVTSPSVTAPTPLHSFNTPLPPEGGGSSAVDEQRDPESQLAARVIARLNEITGRPYPITIELLRRIRAGATEEELLAVVEHKASDPFFAENGYARMKPSTLFGRKFPEYLADASAPEPAPQRSAISARYFS